MAHSVLVYRNLATAPVLALRVVLGDVGRIDFVAGEAHADEARRILQLGLRATYEGPYVTPDDGAEYSRAVVKTLSRSSAWSAVPEIALAGERETVPEKVR